MARGSSDSLLTCLEKKKKIQAMYKVKTVKSENEKFLPHLTVLK